MRRVLERGLAAILPAGAEEGQVEARDLAVGRKDGLEVRFLDVWCAAEARVAGQQEALQRRHDAA